MICVKSTGLIVLGMTFLIGGCDREERASGAAPQFTTYSLVQEHAPMQEGNTSINYFEIRSFDYARRPDVSSAAVDTIKLRPLMMVYDVSEDRRSEMISLAQRMLPPLAVSKGSYKIATLSGKLTVTKLENFLMNHTFKQPSANNAAAKIHRFLRKVAVKRFFLVTSGVSGLVALYEAVSEDEDQLAVPVSTLPQFPLHMLQERHYVFEYDERPQDTTSRAGQDKADEWSGDAPRH